MNIGDRVRFLHDRQEGIVIKFLPHDMVEVEIEEGFRIPVLKSELVVVAKEEAIVFGLPKNPTYNNLTNSNTTFTTATAITDHKVFAEVGVYLAYLPFNDHLLHLHIINNTDIQVLYTFGETNNGSFIGISAGNLAKRSSQKVHELSLQNFEKWSPIIIQSLAFRQGIGTLKEPFCKKLKFSAEAFFKSKKQAPIIHQEGYIFQLDQQPDTMAALAIKPEVIKENMLYNNHRQDIPMKTAVPSTISKPKMEIDLHIEKLTPHSFSMTNSQILQLQLDTFDKKLDDALVGNFPEVTFIHGVGNGVLRNEIHKRLSKHPHVEYFQDAQKEKFGYGATLVKFK